MTSSKSNIELSWNVYSFGILGLFTFFQILQWPLLPRFLDIYYHLSVMKGFDTAGGYVTRAFWEYAPDGRAHLYPPILHVLMLLLHRLGIPVIAVGRLVDCTAYPILLFSFHYLVLKLYNPRLAFWALLVASSVYSLALASFTLSAFNLAVVAGIWAVLQLARGRWLCAAILMGLCFYTHTLAGWLFCLLFILYGCLQKNRLWDAARSVGGASLLSLPLFYYQWSQRGQFSFMRLREHDLFEWDLALYALAAAGLVWLLRARRFKEAALPLAWVGSMLPLLLTHHPRFFAGHGLLGAILLAALAMDRIWEKAAGGEAKRGLALLVSAVLFFSFAAPVLKWDAREKSGGVVWNDRTLTRYLFQNQDRNFRSNSFTVYFPKEYGEMARVIRESSSPDDILWTDFSYTAGILSLLSDRATSCGMLAEVKPQGERNPLQEARILVWFKDKNAKPAKPMLRAIERYGLETIRETEMAFILRNPEGFGKRKVAAPALPFWMLITLLGLAAGGLAATWRRPA